MAASIRGKRSFIWRTPRSGHGEAGGLTAGRPWFSDTLIKHSLTRSFWKAIKKERKNSEPGPFLTIRRSPVQEKRRWLKKNAAGSAPHYRRLLHNSWGQGDIGFGDDDARPWRLLWTRAAMTLRSANREVLMHLACKGENNTHAAVSVEKAVMNPTAGFGNIGQWRLRVQLGPNHIHYCEKRCG